MRSPSHHGGLSRCRIGQQAGGPETVGPGFWKTAPLGNPFPASLETRTHPGPSPRPSTAGSIAPGAPSGNPPSLWDLVTAAK
ncbi:hypothetical protein Micbo1qcDRAFT_209267 [Microdochium bolleyi]|uniref:Uncharacterized protein n=1 Tax=Microdochium bolleyi TaxID=196109 RepID=A0A136IN09_9PEZI|nr:hypothetical protein Micbo1qcDRAFT_209267 [Microdochium bolleyi]